jgi:Glycosyl hydrolase family 26
VSRRARTIAALVLALVAAAASLSSSPAAQAAANRSTLGVYTGAANPGGITDFGSWSGASIGYAADFLADDSWSTIESPTWWLNAWRSQPYRMVYGLPMIPSTGGSLAEGATGAYNDHFRTLARHLEAAGQGNAILRLGWEFGGSWSRWAVKTPADAASYAAYWRQIVTTMRAVAPSLAFDWNPIAGRQPVNPETAYPGDAYVDYIGIDVYDQGWSSGWKDPVKRWADFRSTRWGLDWHRAFASAHGKPMSFPEWGLTIRDDGHGGGDDPYFIRMMKVWIAQNDVAYHVYFDYDAPDGAHNLRNGRFPNGASAFRELFAGSASPAPSLPQPKDLK